MIEDYDVYEPKKEEKICFVVGLVAALCGISLLFYGSVLGVALLPLVGKSAKKIYIRYRVSVRKRRLLLQFRDFLHSLSASFAAGRQMKEAMAEAQQSLSEVYGRDAEMPSELGYMLRRMEETQETDIEALDGFTKRTGLEDVSDFTEVFRACRESGGDFVSGVQRAAAMIGEKIAIEREIHVMVSQKRLEGYIITAMPAVIILFLQLMSPDYLAVLYQTMGGRILMTAALAATALAYVMIERITNIEI